MRLFLFFLLISFHSFAQDCRTSLGDIPGPGTYNCQNLYVDSPITFGTDPSPVVINVTNVVEITANITLDGTDGSSGTGANVPGGAGGPGAGAGGGSDFLSTPQDGDDPFPGSGTANGKAAQQDGTCANGGGGGGMFTAGEDGVLCPTTSTAVGAGGATVPAGEFDFGGSFRGGYGGGAGGLNTGDIGTGAGGGGALHINAGGNVSIASGVTISARGGNGGDAATDGGGGGAGSGGALWIQSTGGIITNLGTIDLRGGTGGRNNITNSHGGDGGDGVFQFEDLNGTTNGSGLELPSASTGGGGGGSSKLSSDISCGTISKASEQNPNNLFMIFAGFGFVSLISFLSRLRRIKVY